LPHSENNHDYITNKLIENLNYKKEPILFSAPIHQKVLTENLLPKKNISIKKERLKEEKRIKAKLDKNKKEETGNIKKENIKKEKNKKNILDDLFSKIGDSIK